MAPRLSSCCIRTSKFWEWSFRRSLDNPPAIPWETVDKLTQAERETIRSSIQEFQLGEQSEGRHLTRVAREYALQSGDAAYSRAVQLFIREEQHHAALLGRFMDLADIARIRHTWVDAVFRRLRRLAGLETSICLLLTAEVIAKIYYRALLSATASPALGAICSRILEDETIHVEFQCERLAILRAVRTPRRIFAAVCTQRLLFAGSVAVVWLRHKPVLRFSNSTFGAYRLACHHEFRECLMLMDPARYAGTDTFQESKQVADKEPVNSPRT